MAPSNKTVVLVYYGRAILTSRPATYAEAVEKAISLFDLAEDDDVYLTAKVTSSPMHVEVAEDAWSSKILAEDGKKFRVEVRQSSDVESDCDEEEVGEDQQDIEEHNDAHPKRKRSTSPDDLKPSKVARLANAGVVRTPQPAPHAPRHILLKDMTGRVTEMKLAVDADLFQVVEEVLGCPQDQCILMHAGRKLEEGRPLGNIGLDGPATVHLILKLRGGKPVIYLFPPSALDSVRVDLTLVPEWTFSALYPLADIHRGKNGTSTTSWTVSASPDGTLVDKASTLALSYLFWEAHAPLLPPSPALLPTDAIPATTSSAFNPGRPSLNRDNAALLPFVPFLAHLDSALISLTLHTSARNDFITYWLPSFQRIHEKGKHIAFRFLDQASYEQSAKLEVEPRPAVVTRVFLLFKGVGEEQAQGWRKVDEVDWVKEVGVEVEAARDEKRFRVLEWGGMEVVG